MHDTFKWVSLMLSIRRMAPAAFSENRRSKTLVCAIEVKKFVSMSGRDLQCPPLARITRSVEKFAIAQGPNAKEPSGAAAQVPRSMHAQSAHRIVIDPCKTGHPPTHSGVGRAPCPCRAGHSTIRRLIHCLSSICWGSHHIAPIK